MMGQFKLSTILFFSLLLIGANLLAFNDFVMPLNWLLWGEIALIVCVLFFFKIHALTYESSENYFVKKLIRISLITNFISIGIVYWACYLNDGTFFEPRAADSVLYHEHGVFLANMFSNYNFDVGSYLTDSDYSDYGYNVFLGFIYWVFAPYTLVARIANVVFHTLSCVLIFKISKSIFDVKTAKIASLLNTFCPLLVFFVGVSLKETLMIFLLLLATYQAVDIIINNKIKPIKFLFLILTTLSLFFFRTVLGIVFLSGFSAFYVYNLSFKKNIYKIASIFGLLFVFSILIYYIIEIGFAQKIMDTLGMSSSQTNAELADKIRSGGGKGGGGLSVKVAIIIPLLFISVLIAPFPTFVFLDDQVEIVWLFFGCILKNILVFFALVGMFNSLKHLKKKSILILAILIGYSLVISVAAQSTSIRYQLVSLPFINILAAYGLTKYSPKLKTLWFFYLLFIFISIISWNYFKLSIRGLI